MQPVFAFNLLFLIFVLSGCRESSPHSPDNILFSEPLIHKTLERVRKEYVEEPNEKKMLEGALNGMLMALDPYSCYLNPESFKLLTDSTRGEYGGLGMEVLFSGGVLKVVAPMDDTPAYKAGIKSGDIITHVDSIALNGLIPEDCLKRLHGKPDSSVTLKIYRSPNITFQVNLVRQLISVNPVKYRIEGTIGYIRISYFNDQTTDKLNEAITAIMKNLSKNLRGIILDLRNNPGGTLEQAVSVSNVFLDSGIIVHVKGRNTSLDETFKAKPDRGQARKLKNIPIAVLINQGSASASEIVAAALRDNQRAVLVGEKTFGKGSVQALYALENYGGIKITIARFFTPSGKEIQGKGIQPDINVPAKTLPEKELGKEPGEEKAQEKKELLHNPDDEDKQMQRGLDVLQGLWAVKLNSQ